MFSSLQPQTGPVERNLGTAKQMQDTQLALSEAANPAGSAAPAGAASALSHRMLTAIVDTAESHSDATQLALTLAQRAVSAPERNVYALWYRMLNDSKSAPSFRAETVGLDAVPPVRRWFVSHATHVQNLLCRCPRLRRMCVALRWLEDTFEPPAVAELVAPYAPPRISDGANGAAVRDPDLEHKIFLQLRAGRWERASQLAEQGAAQIAHIVRTGVMPAADAQKTAWLGKMPRAGLFGEYEAQNDDQTKISLIADKKRNPHRLPLMLRMLEHLTTNGAHNNNNNNNSNGNGNNDHHRGGKNAAGAASAPTSAVGLDGASAPSPTTAASPSSSSSSSSDYFAGIAALICGDEAGMKAACRSHFGSTASSVLQHQFRNAAAATSSSSAPPLSWQDELWSLLRSCLVAAFTVAILRGASDSPDTTLTDLFEGVFDKSAVESFVSTMETRCGLSGGMDHVALDDGAFDWYRAMEGNLGDNVVARLRSLSSRIPSDSADGVALQSLTLFLSDSAQGMISPHMFPSLTAAVAPATPSRASSLFVPWCLSEQAALSQLLSLACQQSLLPSGASTQSTPAFADIMCAMITECLCNPAFDIHHIIPHFRRVALFSSLTLEGSKRVLTHTAALRAMRIRFFGDLGRYMQNETNSAEGEMARCLRETDALLHNGNVNAVDNALKNAANRLRDDPSVPMLTHDTRCESVLWKSLMTPGIHHSAVVIEAINTLRDLWNDNRNLNAMNDICNIWEHRLRDVSDEMISSNGGESPNKMGTPSVSGSGMRPTSSSGSMMGSPKSSVQTLIVTRELITFWCAVLRCHDQAKTVAGIVAQLQQQQQSSLLPSRRHDLCVQLRDVITNELARSFDSAAELCPKYGGTAIAACLELLAESVRTALPHVDNDSMTRLFQLAFAKVPALEATHVLGYASRTALPPSAAGVDLLPSGNAASLMRTLQALRAAYVSQKQRRAAAAADDQ